MASVLFLFSNCISRICVRKEAFARVRYAKAFSTLTNVSGCLLQKYPDIYTTDPIDHSEEKFDKILIANRGEIACRVMKTCRAMGIKTVAVYSDVDFNSMHVEMADEHVCIGPAQAIHSYLNMDNILEAILKTGSKAVHPGYGFLSENAEFAERLAQKQIVFIGPSPKALRGMGDKIMSKKLAKDAGVNIIPGFDGVVKSAEECVQIARDIGYPVMIKASAGGGGKGMRIAWNDDDAKDGFRLSSQEAAASFGDDRILVEKFIDNPRHVEIQVLADNFGNVVYLNERECSIQRRNQKVIEEAPSPFIDEDTRRAMGAQAVSLAKHVGYSSAGTVEFLIDSEKKFYFLEMNTRLQVEHPITECITGVDLVHQMIRTAKGHKLRLTQSDISIRGWGIESRVYAEDPYKNFGLPSVGRLHTYLEPTHIPKVRCDSGVREGDEISIYYDPMICKLITYGKTRQDAIDVHLDALDAYVIRGVSHNVSLLRDIMTEPEFVAGNISTKYLPKTYPDGFQGKQFSEREFQHLAALACAFHAKAELRAYSFNNNLRSVTTTDTPRRFHVHIEMLDRSCEARITADGKDITVVIDGCDDTFRVDWSFSLSAPVATVSVNGERHTVQLLSTKPSQSLRLQFRGTAVEVQVMASLAAKYSKMLPVKPKEENSKVIVSPMPGLVKSVTCQVGQTVVEGQEVCVIEAMKMQNRFLATATGKVKTVNINVGDTVDEGAILVEVE